MGLWSEENNLPSLLGDHVTTCTYRTSVISDAIWQPVSAKSQNAQAMPGQAMPGHLVLVNLCKCPAQAPLASLSVIALLSHF